MVSRMVENSKSWIVMKCGSVVAEKLQNLKLLLSRITTDGHLDL